MNVANIVRGIVKTVFILCYVAFMWASIHHVAAYFGNFEQAHNTDFGTYLLAGAFDLTALVTTIGVMFFRKSMPRYVQVIVWAFIVAIALYSYFINWEYAAHYQNNDLIMQPTGRTIPVYDAKGVLHYVPEMEANTMLLWINPVIASGFTIFALIYSIVAEFFGTKPPSIEELKERQKYLEETSETLKTIKELEEKHKGKSLIQRAKETAMEVKSAVNEVRKEQVIVEESGSNQEDIAETSESNPEVNGEENQSSQDESGEGKIPAWLSTGGTTIHISEVIKHVPISKRKLSNRIGKEIRATKNRDIVYKDSLIAWLNQEGIPLLSERNPHIIPETLGSNPRVIDSVNEPIKLDLTHRNHKGMPAQYPIDYQVK